MVRCWANVRRMGFTDFSSRLEKAENGEYPSVVLVVGRQIELEEDVGDVFLHRPDGHHQVVGGQDQNVAR